MSNKIAVIDIKTGAHTKLNCVQVAAYRYALKKYGPSPAGLERVDEKDGHNYTFAGKKVAGVTDIIHKHLNGYKFPEWKTEAAERGTWIHERCAGYINMHSDVIGLDIADVKTTNPELVGYLEAFKDFLALSALNFNFAQTEVLTGCPQWAGTSDIYIPNSPRDICALLYLKPDGTFKFQEVKDWQTVHLPSFLCAAFCENYKP